jgi:hypothetical protein
MCSLQPQQFMTRKTQCKIVLNAPAIHIVNNGVQTMAMSVHAQGPARLTVSYHVVIRIVVAPSILSPLAAREKRSVSLRTGSSCQSSGHGLYILH